MTLPLRDMLTLLMPPSVYYRRRIADETGEPELALISELIRRGGIAVDVGANHGFYAFALSRFAGRVMAFEPNPDYALFARWMLRGRAGVHQFALSNRSGRATFQVPVSRDGIVLHFSGSLTGDFSEFPKVQAYDVELRTLDSFDLSDVSFIKIDVEGTERDVLDGARATIMRDRPPMVIELLSGAHADPYAVTEGICRDFGYDAYAVQGREKFPALPIIASLGKNSTYNTSYESRNVLFVPR